MGQICGPSVLCDLDKTGPSERHWSSHAAAQAHALTSDEAARKVDQLGLELRMLKDDNYRIREEQLRLEKELKANGQGLQWRGGGGLDSGSFLGVGMDGRSGNGGSFLGVGMEGHGGRRDRDVGSFVGVGMDGRSAAAAYQNHRQGPDSEQQQQLRYMKEVVRQLQAENSRLRGKAGVGSPNRSHGGSSAVSEEEYRKLQRHLKGLQQQHLQQVQRARQWQGAGSASASTAISGVSTPLGSSQYGLGSEDPRALRAQFEALQREQEELRGKVRRLAHNC
eukprot:TRINITY_DN104894_c0_g1_i1.p1 TRINITY_DN104894_c0_g1~~TRINITY_DN104894_c0_g1_i1.p1  ORF type:complete len:304 (+),score=67.11 TRINITY_DN104894_c0_g1_i1:76-912(+)